MLSERKIWTIISILATIGIGLALYLSYNYLSPHPLELCNINSTVNCNAVTKGELRQWFGVPVPFVGLLGYIIILISASFKQKKLALAMTTFGMLFCLRLTFLEIFVLKVICPVCILCQLDMLTVFTLTVMLLRRPKLQAEEVSQEE
jgi:uncharacterized membrane protein